MNRLFRREALPRTANWNHVARTDQTRAQATSAETMVACQCEMIHYGELRPGDRLSPERDLAEQLGVGRPIVGHRR